jgi:hypothetical protein
MPHFPNIGFIYVVDAHFIDKIEKKKNPGPKCLWKKMVRDSREENACHAW